MSRLIFRGFVTLLLLCFSLLSARQVRADSAPFLIDNFGQQLFTGQVSAPTLSAFPPPSGVSLTEFSDSKNPDAMGMLTTTTLSLTSFMYTYTVGSDTFTWTLPINPAIAPGNSSCAPTMPPSLCSFTIPNESFTLNGEKMTGTFDFFDTSNSGGFDLVGPPSVPEPSTILLSAIGLAIGLALSVLRKN